MFSFVLWLKPRTTILIVYFQIDPRKTIRTKIFHSIIIEASRKTTFFANVFISANEICLQKSLYC